MGIYRLTTRLLHKAQRVAWTTSDDDRSSQSHREEKIVIIDGPSFAYHIYYRNLQRSDRGASVDSSYNALNQALITALEELEALGFQIRHIYFDGILPAQKLSTRISRLEKYASQTVAIRQKYDRTAKARRGRVKLDAILQHARHDRQLPPPPFLVSSMIEALSTSRYADVTEVIPDEAEIFCAFAADKLDEEQSLPIYVLTNDSDMLALVTGSNTRVVLLEHMERRSDSNSVLTMQVLLLKPIQLAHEAGLPDLTVVARIMERDPHCTFEAATTKAAAQHGSNKKFRANVCPLTATSATSKLGLQQKQLLRFCDPRMTEVLYQCLPADGLGSLSIFLPFVMDDPLRASAWQCGAALRHIGINVLLQLSGLPLEAQEYDRKGRKFTPIALEIPRDVDEQLNGFAIWFDRHLAALKVCNNAEKWRVVGMVALLSDMSNRDKPLPQLDVIHDIICSKKDPGSWEKLHLQAQWHAMLYSFRLLKTTVTFVLACHRDTEHSEQPHASTCLPDLLALERMFLDVPSIPELFDLPMQKLSQVAASQIVGSLEALAIDLGEVPDENAMEMLDGSDDSDDQSAMNCGQHADSNPYSLLAS